MKRELNTILFDVGGTLVQAPDLYTEFANEWKTEERVNKEIFYQKLLNIKNRKADKFDDVKTILKKLSRHLSDQYKVENLEHKTTEIYRKVFLDSASLYPQVQETLTFLKNKGIRLFIVSDADADILYPQMERLGIKDFFDDWFVSSEVKAYKPSDIMADKVASTLPVQRDSIIMVGDAQDDVATARKLKIPSVLINESSEQKSTPPDFVIPAFSNLLGLLKHNYDI